MVGNHTFHLHHWRLVFGFFIIHDCINPWNYPRCIINCGSFLDFVYSPNVLLSMREIPQQMLFSATPKFQGFSLWVISLSWGWYKRFISTLVGEILLIHTSSTKYYPRTLPIVLRSWGFKPLLIESWTTLLFLVLVRFCLLLELFIIVPCLPDNIF